MFGDNNIFCATDNWSEQLFMSSSVACYFTSSICRRAHVERASGSDTRPSLLPSATERIWLTRLARLACSPSLDWWKEMDRHSEGDVSGFSLSCERLKYLSLYESSLAQVLYLEVIKNHLSELLHRRASGGLVEHRCFSPWLRLLAQLVVHNFPQPAADDPIMVSPASCVYLPNKKAKQTLKSRTLRVAKFKFNRK